MLFLNPFFKAHGVKVMSLITIQLSNHIILVVINQANHTLVFVFKFFWVERNSTETFNNLGYFVLWNMTLWSIHLRVRLLHSDVNEQAWESDKNKTIHSHQEVSNK
jgi:hypothetical protein